MIFGVALAVGASFLLSDYSSLERKSTYMVRFPIHIGAPGLKVGSSVMLGGQQVGRVRTVEFDSDVNPAFVDVNIAIPAHFTMFSNAVISLERPLIGSLSSINISNVGKGTVDGTRAGGELLAAGSTIIGSLAPPAIMAQAGITPREVEAIKRSIISLDDSLLRISKVIEDRAPDVSDAIVDARAIIKDLRAKFGGWSTSVDTTLASIESAAGKIDPLINDAGQVMTEVKAIATDARAFVTSIQGVVDENREGVRSIIKSIDSVATKVDTKIIEELTTSFDMAQSAMASLEVSVKQVSSIINEQTPVVRRIMANLRLMSDNLKLTAVEVRSQPWRALHAPTTKELSTQSLYDATRAYAEASSDVRSASESLQSLLAAASTNGSVTAQDGSSIEEVSEQLKRSIEGFRAAERRLLEVLVREEGK